MAKKTRKIEEINKEQNVILEENIAFNQNEDIVNCNEVSDEEDILEDYEVTVSKKEEPIVDETKEDEKKIEENPYKKKMAQRFFGNYIWNGMVTDIVIPKQK